MSAGHPEVEKIMAGIRDSIKTGTSKRNTQHYNEVYDVLWKLVLIIEKLKGKASFPIQAYKKIRGDYGNKYDSAMDRIPLEMIMAHCKQAHLNHYQSVHRLAERGGLAPSEAVAVLEDREWGSMDEEVATLRLNRLYEEWKTRDEY